MDESVISDEFIAYAAQLYLPEIPGLDWLPVCRQWAAKVRDPNWLRDSGISPGWDRYALYAEYYRDPLSLALAVAWKCILLTHYQGTPLGSSLRWRPWFDRPLTLRKQRMERFPQANTAQTS